MGSGSWTTASFLNYSKSKGLDIDDSTAKFTRSYSNQELFVSKKLNPMLDPQNITRECKDSEEHPNTFPVILALDVTGSMGVAAVAVATNLNDIMSKLYDTIPDIEIMVMGIGDLAYDNAPLQVSQFESDIRIAEQLDKIYFEFGGGGNSYESYTAAWYFASRHTNIDCIKRDKKGLIITMGDENLNPYLPHYELSTITGDRLQEDIATSDLYNEVIKKYDIYHINVEHRYISHGDVAPSESISSFSKVIGVDNAITTNIDNISDTIIRIIQKEYERRNTSNSVYDMDIDESNENDDACINNTPMADGFISW